MGAEYKSGIQSSAPIKTKLFELADIPVPMVHATYRIIRDCNEDFARIFGYERDELVGQSFSKLYPEITDFVRTGNLWRSNFTGGRTYYDERVMRHQSGTGFWCRVFGRSSNYSDPFAEAVYCFDPMRRDVAIGNAVLSDKQKQVLVLIAQGKTNADIAVEMALSKRTVESHRLRLMRKFNLKNTAELVAWFSSQQP